MATEKKMDRSLFKTKTSVEELQANDKKIENLIDKKNSDYAGFLKIENGVNKFRIYPGHPREDGVKPQWIASKQTWWLPFLVEEKDEKGEVKKDKKGQPIMTEKNKPVFDARNHSNIDKDIVAIYIDILSKQLHAELKDTKKVEEKMKCINGSYAENIQGIKGKPGWIVYVDKYTGAERTFGRVEFPKAVRNRINQLISTEQSNEPIAVDGIDNPFTDPDDGRLLIITYNKNATKAADYYTTEIDSSFDRVTKKANVVPLTNEDLEAFEKYPSINDLYLDIYTKKDFDLAIQGLQLFDAREEFGILDNEEFLDAVQELRDKYPDAPEEENKVAEQESDEFDFDSMNRDELKKFARVNMTGIVVLPKMSDDDIRTALKQWVESQNEGGTEEEPETEKEEVETEEEKPKEKIEKVETIEKISASSKESLKDKMAKAKLASSKK